VNDSTFPSPTDDGADEAPSSTIAFVDLIQFTSLTNVHGDLAAADAAGALESITRDLMGESVRLIKTAGDGVLLQASTPQDGLRCIAKLIERLHEAGFDARAGADHGTVILRNDDVFGSTVNLASRLASIAQPGSVAVTRLVALAATELGFSASPLGQVEVKGFHTTIELFEVDPCHHHDHWLTDPVCGMRLEPGKAVAVAAAEESGIGFCSAQCADLFAHSPELYGQVSG
jgi:adenylate cyclase